MVACPDTPAKVTDGIVGAGVSSVANALHRIPSERTYGCRCVAGAHEYWICSMSKVIATSKVTLLMGANMVVWWRRQTKTRSGQSFTRGFKSNDG